MPLSMNTIYDSNIDIANGTLISCTSDDTIAKNTFVSDADSLDVTYGGVVTSERALRVINISDTEVISCTNSSIRYTDLTADAYQYPLDSQYDIITDMEYINGYVYVLNTSDSRYTITKYRMNKSNGEISLTSVGSTTETIENTDYSCNGGSIRKLNDSTMIVILRNVREVHIVSTSPSAITKTHGTGVFDQYISRCYQLYKTGNNEYLIYYLSSPYRDKLSFTAFTIDKSFVYTSKSSSDIDESSDYCKHTILTQFHDRVFLLTSINNIYGGSNTEYYISCNAIALNESYYGREYSETINIKGLARLGNFVRAYPIKISDNLISIYVFGSNSITYANCMYKINILLDYYNEETGSSRIKVVKKVEYSNNEGYSANEHVSLIYSTDTDVYIFCPNEQYLRISSIPKVIDSATTPRPCIGITSTSITPSTPGKIIAINGGY